MEADTHFCVACGGREGAALARRNRRRPRLADPERRAEPDPRGNLRHNLRIDYRDLTPSPPDLPERPEAKGYVRPPFEDQNFVPETW